ncbi:hypothetical protein BN903_84 [Halorubrum sp. AJ67]|nr:hypothetical protein BN903_84 [Halorubrum sp. AJ67]
MNPAATAERDPGRLGRRYRRRSRPESVRIGCWLLLYTPDYLMYLLA